MCMARMAIITDGQVRGAAMDCASQIQININKINNL